MNKAVSDRCAYSRGIAVGVEVIELELFTPEVSFGLHMFLALWPLAGRAGYWAGVVEAGERVVSVAEWDISLPRASAGFELRGPGLWADAVCEDPFVHWSYGLEAFALRYEDPTDAITSQRGERVPLGYELEWEATAAAIDLGNSASSSVDYRQGGIAHGEVLIGAATYDVAGYGCRSHRVAASLAQAQVATVSWRCQDDSWQIDAGQPNGQAIGRSLTRLAPPDAPAVVAERILWRGENGTSGWSRSSYRDGEATSG